MLTAGSSYARASCRRNVGNLTAHLPAASAYAPESCWSICWLLLYLAHHRGSHWSNLLVLTISGLLSWILLVKSAGSCYIWLVVVDLIALLQPTQHLLLAPSVLSGHRLGSYWSVPIFTARPNRVKLRTGQRRGVGQLSVVSC